MEIFILILVGILGILHLYIMYLEMFAAPTKQAETFGMPLNFVELPNAQTALQNQGIYNGSLGLTILVSLFLFAGDTRMLVSLIFMLFIIVVGIFGGKTVTKSIYFIQAIPGALISILILLYLI